MKTLFSKCLGFFKGCFKSKNIFDLIRNSSSRDDHFRLVSLIKENPDILKVKNEMLISPLREAINVRNFNVAEHIITRYHEHIGRESLLDELIYACNRYFHDIKDNSLGSSNGLKLVKLIYQKYLETDQEITYEEIVKLKDIFEAFRFLELSFSKNSFPTYSKEFFEYLRIKIDELITKNSRNSDDSFLKEEYLRFLDSSKEVLQKIDSDEPIIIGDKKIYIKYANILNHCSFFLFHVDSNNDITEISYCDGNVLFEEQINLDKENYLNGGEIKFSVQKTKFSKEFVEGFLKMNCRGLNLKCFYKRILYSGLFDDKGKVILKPSQLKKAKFLIPTKNQERKNCTYKSLKILLRSIAQMKNPDFNFSLYAGVKLSSNEFLDQSKLHPDNLAMLRENNIKINARCLFKKFKNDLIVSCVESLKDIKKTCLTQPHKTSVESSSVIECSEIQLTEQPLKINLASKIDDTLNSVQYNAKKKIASVKTKNENGSKNLARLIDLVSTKTQSGVIRELARTQI